MKIDFGTLYGNKVLKDALSRKMEQHAFSHAYLIEGPAGSGKKTLALTVAAALSCTSKETVPCRICPNCRKIFAMQSPDLHLVGIDPPAPVQAAVSPKKKTAPAKQDAPQDKPDEKDTPRSIGVDAVRTQIRAHFEYAPNDLDRRIFIVNRADTMTVEAQNALLKDLEEPSGETLFLLLCEDRTKMLPTIRSRVQLLRTEQFPDKELSTLLLAHEPEAKALYERDPDTFRLYVRLSGGAYGCALQYIRGNGEDLPPVFTAHRCAEQCLTLYFDRTRPLRVSLSLCIAEQIPTRNMAKLFLGETLNALRDLLLLAETEDGAGNVPLLFFTDRALAESYAQSVGIRRLFGLYDELSGILSSIDANPNLNAVQFAVVLAFCSQRNR